ncbi:MAG: hypothetical protein Q8Q12_03960 [bacterium]|nr:hypothetical protein [bacterium]
MRAVRKGQGKNVAEIWRLGSAGIFVPFVFFVVLSFPSPLSVRDYG